MTAKWILRENLYVWLEIVAGFVRAEFDEDDRNAVEIGIRDTNVERQRWFEYAFKGSRELDVRIACDPGTSVVFVDATGPEGSRDLAVQVDTITDVLAHWKLAKEAGAE